MAKAHRAPNPHRPLYRYVSQHAIERLRTRTLPDSLQFRSDEDLGRWLDEAVEHAIGFDDRRWQIRDFSEDNARLVSLCDRIEGTYAIVKRDDKGKHFDEAIVTIADENMASQLKQRTPSRMAEQLAKLDVKPTVRKPLPPEPPVAEDPPPTVRLVVTYVGDDGPTFVMTNTGDLQRLLRELATDDLVETETIQVWKEVPSRIEVRVEVEL